MVKSVSVCDLIDQLKSAPGGRGSLRTRPVAADVPVFVIVTVKPIGLPAVIEDWSAVLVMLMTGKPPKTVSGSEPKLLVSIGLAGLFVSPL